MNTNQVVGGASSAWSDMSTHRASRREKHGAQADGGSDVDATALQQLLAQVQESAAGTAATASQVDPSSGTTGSGGNGSADSGELDAALRALTAPPPSTMDFAQSRAGDDTGGPPPDGGLGGLGGLMDRIAQASDTDANGSLDQDELGKLGDTLASAFESALQSLGGDAGTTTAAAATSVSGTQGDASTDGSSGDTSSGDAASQLAQRLATLIAQQYAQFSGGGGSPDTSVRMAA